MKVWLGAEDDVVTLREVGAQELVVLDGGSGTDTYDDWGGNGFGAPLALKKIEIVN